MDELADLRWEDEHDDLAVAPVFLARTGATREEIRPYVEEPFDYFLDETLDDLRSTYPFEVARQRSVPQSILAFLESTGYEEAIRTIVSGR